MKNIKTRNKNGGLDKYYTNIEYAIWCCNKAKSTLRNYTFTNILEPAAGNGIFIDAIDKVFNSEYKIAAIDIKPERKDIKKKDFFEHAFDGQSTLVIGNPPFGFSSTLAVKFFNHCAKNNSKIIAFILPRTFQKYSIQDKLDKYYKLIFEEQSPKNSFTINGEEYNVPTVFQIWTRTKKPRKNKIYNVNNKWIEYTTPDKATFCIRRVGGKAGQILSGKPTDYSITSTYFCKEKIKGAKVLINNIDFSKIVNLTSGVKSLSKREITRLLEEAELDGS